MTEKINWTNIIYSLKGEMVKEVGEASAKEAIEVLEKHKDFLTGLAKEEVIMMLHYLAGGAETKIEPIVYMAMLRSLSDEDFLNLRKQIVNSASSWHELDKKKKEVVKDMTSKVGKAVSEILIRYLLLG